MPRAAHCGFRQLRYRNFRSSPGDANRYPEHQRTPLIQQRSPEQLPTKVALRASLLFGLTFGGGRGVRIEVCDGHVADGASDSTDDQKSTAGSNCRIASDDVFTPFSK
jgi:hypothetical protein